MGVVYQRVWRGECGVGINTCSGICEGGVVLPNWLVCEPFGNRPRTRRARLQKLVELVTDYIIKDGKDVHGGANCHPD